MSLTKADIADRLFEEVGLNKREAKEFVDAYFETIRGALEEGVGGDARRDVGEAARRQRGRATDDEVPGAERGVLTDEDLSRVHEPVEDAVEFVLRDDDLQMLGGELVGDADGDIEIDDEHTPTVGPERGAGRRSGLRS